MYGNHLTTPIRIWRHFHSILHLIPPHHIFPCLCCKHWLVTPEHVMVQERNPMSMTAAKRMFHAMIALHEDFSGSSHNWTRSIICTSTVPSFDTLSKMGSPIHRIGRVKMTTRQVGLVPRFYVPPPPPSLLLIVLLMLRAVLFSLQGSYPLAAIVNARSAL